ncbi:hypothetical protein O2N63_16580 [Aliiroseovarius sp. KMU-50]|uniref:Uncharacterized protein n=1 Tax=Aliiroseovarius salicola TaxID=3009082 RepID=A0ABT4W5A6_9RHOB|nr:hypothetical protein [Aliiroseovarius sp. KMU-50]MDA5095709.1 hypothetical protein [Aliiroseovarius sp. KMU-50]
MGTMIMSSVRHLKTMWKAAPLATVLLAVTLAAAMFFGVRTVTQAIYWNNPAHIDQPLAGWMTPRYISHSWDIPREEMFKILKWDNLETRPGTLGTIADQRGLSLDHLVVEIETGIATYRQTLPKLEVDQ